MSITLGGKSRWIATSLLLWVIVAVVMIPVVAAIDLAARGTSAGWPDDLADYALLTGPYLLILGTPGVILYLISLCLVRPRRQLAVVLALLVGGGCFVLLVALPRGLTFDEVTLRAGLASLPLWLAFGALVRVQPDPHPDKS